MELFDDYSYLAIQVANTFGLDKELWIDRLLWVEENKDSLLSLVPKAEDPIQYKIAVHNLEYGQGNVQLDATASGLQILSCMTHDERTMTWTNLLDGDNRYDIYTELYNKMELCKEQGIERSQVKKAIMTAFYGSQATPKKLLGEGEELDEFYAVLEEYCEYPWIMNKLLLGAWNPKADRHAWIMPDGFHVNVPVYRKVTKSMQIEGRTYYGQVSVQGSQSKGLSLGANVVHSLDALVAREVIRRCWYTQSFPEHQHFMGHVELDALKVIHDQWERTGFLSARVLSIIHEHGMKVLDRCSTAFTWKVYELLASLGCNHIKVLTIHDCFGVNVNHGNQLRKTYNQVLAELADSTVGFYILEQITGKKYERDEDRHELVEKIYTANYALS